MTLAINLVIVNMYGLAKCVLLLSAAIAATSFSLGPNDVVFHLFTRNNPTQSQVLFPSISSIMSSSFNTLLRTVITIHSNEGFGNFNNFVVPAHLEAEDVNILAVDWTPGAITYTDGVAQANQCGQVIAQFVNILSTNFGYQASQYRIVGVGLGGHIAGIAARNINGNVPHIIALDPSLHGWTHHSGRLGPDAAGIVEVLHTTAGFLGYDYPLGDLDFYANGGSAQFGCGIDLSCSRTYAYVYYAESVTAFIRGGNRFIGTACNNYESATTVSCNGARNAIFGGTDIKTSGSGVYVFLTNTVQPFARD